MCWSNEKAVLAHLFSTVEETPTEDSEGLWPMKDTEGRSPTEDSEGLSNLWILAWMLWFRRSWGGVAVVGALPAPPPSCPDPSPPEVSWWRWRTWPHRPSPRAGEPSSAGRPSSQWCPLLHPWLAYDEPPFARGRAGDSYWCDWGGKSLPELWDPLCSPSTWR